MPEHRKIRSNNSFICRCFNNAYRARVFDHRQAKGCFSSVKLSYLGISECYFQKNFKNMVVITPTAHKGILRFNFIMGELRKDTRIDCKGLSAFYNYYDFSHFSGDLKKYCGVCILKFNME